MPPTPGPLGAGPCIGATLLHTAQLAPAALRAARLLVEGAFAGGFDEQDWDHALGGLHALVHDGGELVAHGAVVQRRLVLDGRTLRAGYVEAIAVHPLARRRGHASALMSALEEVVRGGYDLGALSATDDGARLYAGRGWQRWRGTTWALTPGGTGAHPRGRRRRVRAARRGRARRHR